jgi:hypothetical protein
VIPVDQEGKGKDGEDAIDEEDEFDKAYAKFQANKKQKDQKQFPKLHGPHEKQVKHPSEIFPKWHSFSMELKIKWYARYVEYIENWKKGKNASFKNGIGLASLPDWTDEDEAAFQANMAAIKQSDEPCVRSAGVADPRCEYANDQGCAAQRLGDAQLFRDLSDRSTHQIGYSPSYQVLKRRPPKEGQRTGSRRAVRWLNHRAVSALHGSGGNKNARRSSECQQV